MPFNTSLTPDQAGRWIIPKFGGPSVLEWETWDPFSELPADQVLVRIITAGLSGVENIQRTGGYPNPRCQEPGFTPGYDFVGEVIAIGSVVRMHTELSIGDRVASMCVIGAHATHIVLPDTELIRLQPTDDPVKVCALPLNYMTAWGVLKRSGVDLSPGSSILIGSASGGVGTAIAQVVHVFDLRLKMIGTCSPGKFDFVKSLGITPIDRSAPDLVEQVRALTNGEGVDVAYDAVGSEDSLLKSHQAAKKDVGQVICLGVMSEITKDGSGLVNGSIDLNIFAKRMPPRTKLWVIEGDYYNKVRQTWREDFLLLLNKVRSGELVPEITKLFRLSEAVEANEQLVSGTTVKGKMIFLVDEALAAHHRLGSQV